VIRNISAANGRQVRLLLLKKKTANLANGRYARTFREIVLEGDQ